MIPEQSLGADFLAPRRRRPRVDPTLLDWKKLTGDENVSVINRMSGKKVRIVSQATTNSFLSTNRATVLRLPTRSCLSLRFGDLISPS